MTDCIMLQVIYQIGSTYYLAPLTLVDAVDAFILEAFPGGPKAAGESLNSSPEGLLDDELVSLPDGVVNQVRSCPALLLDDGLTSETVGPFEPFWCTPGNAFDETMSWLAGDWMKPFDSADDAIVFAKNNSIAICDKRIALNP